MTTTPYARRQIQATFTLGTGTYGEGLPNTVTVSGLRASVDVTESGQTAMGAMQLRIFGVKLETMNRLSTLGLKVTEQRKNSILVKAGDSTSGMSSVFEGTIHDAWADMEGQPDAALNVQAAAGLFFAIKPVPPRSYPGPADVAVIMADLAKDMGLKLENSGVSGVILNNPYLPGTARAQVVRVAKSANINFNIDGAAGVLAIWPKGMARGTLVPLISPETGMIGYPTFTSQGIALRTLYDPAITYGSAIQVKSSITPACGRWIIQSLTHNLSSETPGGPWWSTIQAVSRVKRGGRVSTRRQCVASGPGSARVMMTPVA